MHHYQDKLLPTSISFILNAFKLMQNYILQSLFGRLYQCYTFMKDKKNLDTFVSTYIKTAKDVSMPSDTR